MSGNINRECHKCAEPYDYVDVSTYLFSLSGLLRCRYCEFYNEIRPPMNSWRRRALFVLIFLLTVSIIFFGLKYFFSQTIAPAPFLSDPESYKNTEHYALHSKVYESKSAVGIAGVYLFLVVCLPAFILTRWIQNTIYYFRSTK